MPYEMRARRAPAIAVLLAAGTLARASRADPQKPAAVDVEQARALDREGARAFRDGRYRDAIRYFEDAHALGAPAIEVWNVARCYVKLDDPEDAAATLQSFLALPGAAPEDRAEARAQLAQLERRHSTLTVTSSPPGAAAFVDGRPAGRTPSIVDLSPGEHAVAVRRGDVTLREERVTARYGRAVIVDASGGAHIRPPPLEARRFTLRGDFGFLWASLGKIGGVVHPAGMLGVGYAVVRGDRFVLTLGLRGTLTYDTLLPLEAPGGAGATGGPCAAATNAKGTALSGFVDAAFGVRFARAWRIEEDLGVGAAGYFLPQAGGEAFVATCSPSPGVKPALLFGVAVSYRVVPALRVVAVPAWLEVQPAFDGTRTSPTDASAAWVRIGSAIGLAVDL